MRMISSVIAALLATAACSQAPTETTNDQTTAPAETGAATTESNGEATPNIPAPRRQAGLWTFTEIAANGDELAVDTLCVGPKSEAKYSAFRQIGSLCSSRTFTKTATGYSYVTVCGPPGMKPVTTRGTLTGDVAIGYALDEVMDISNLGDRSKTVAKRVGDCPAGTPDGQMRKDITGLVYSVLMQ